MEYPRLGGSGLVVSRVVLGCMGFGDPNRGNHTWSIGPDEARPLIRSAIESGITTFDTANVYSLGSSEEIVGQALGEFARRDEVLIATKVHGRMGPGPNGGGLSRAAIMTQVDESLRRLRTDYIDLYQIHRYDASVPVEETMAALHDLVRAGKVRYLGASSMWAWQFAKMQHAADSARLDPLRGDAGPVQPADARGGAGDAAVLPRRRGRGDPVEPAGPRPAHPRLGGDDRAEHDGPLRRLPLPAGRGERPQDRRGGDRGGAGARRHPGAGRAGLGAATGRASPRRSSASPAGST